MDAAPLGFFSPFSFFTAVLLGFTCEPDFLKEKTSIIHAVTNSLNKHANKIHSPPPRNMYLQYNKRWMYTAMASHLINIHCTVIVLWLMISVFSSSGFSVLACLSRIKAAILNQSPGSAGTPKMMVTMVTRASGGLQLNTNSVEHWSQHSSCAQSSHFIKVMRRENILRSGTRFSLSETGHILHDRPGPTSRPSGVQQL